MVKLRTGKNLETELQITEVSFESMSKILFTGGGTFRFRAILTFFEAEFNEVTMNTDGLLLFPNN